MEKEVKITTTISRSLYLKVYFFLYFRMRWWLLLILYGCMIALTAMGWKEARAEQSLPAAFFTLVFVTVALPLVAWFQANRRYTSNQRLKGPLHFTLNAEALNVKGDTFDNTLGTVNFTRIIETKNTFLLVLDRAQTQIFPKGDLSAEQLKSVREILGGLPAKKKLYS